MYRQWSTKKKKKDIEKEWLEADVGVVPKAALYRNGVSGGGASPRPDNMKPKDYRRDFEGHESLRGIMGSVHRFDGNKVAGSEDCTYDQCEPQRFIYSIMCVQFIWLKK